MTKFWSDPSVEPKRGYRWLFMLQGSLDATDKIETYAVKSVKKPSFAVSEVPHQFVAHTFYFPGRVTWNTVDVTFIDPVVPDQSAVITNMFVKAGYNAPKSQQDSLRSFSKENFVAAIGEASIHQLDADGNTIEEWTLHNSFFTAVDFGQLDYTSEELVINQVTLRYDYATFQNYNTTPGSLLRP